MKQDRRTFLKTTAFTGAAVAAGTINPAAADENVLQKSPLSKRINSSRTPGDDPTLIEPIELGPQADAAALATLMDDPENLTEIADLFGQDKSG